MTYNYDLSIIVTSFMLDTDLGIKYKEGRKGKSEFFKIPAIKKKS